MNGHTDSPERGCTQAAVGQRQSCSKEGRPMSGPWLPGTGSRIPGPLRKEQLLSPPPLRKKDWGNVSRQGPRDPGTCLHVSTLG